MKRLDRTFLISKGGKPIEAKFEGVDEFTRTEVHEPLSKERVFAVDTESIRHGSELLTCLVPIAFHDRDVLIKTEGGRGMLERLFDAIFDRPDFVAIEEKPSFTVQEEGGAACTERYQGRARRKTPDDRAVPERLVQSTLRHGPTSERLERIASSHRSGK